jgi:hypothetical protein
VFCYGQTEDQYIFIHDALLEAVICGNTEVAARNLHTHIQKLMLPETGENITGMELEFKVSIAFRMFSLCYFLHGLLNPVVTETSFILNGYALFFPKPSS